MCFTGTGGTSYSIDADFLRSNGLQTGAVLPFFLRDNRCVYVLPSGALVRGIPSSEGEGGCGFQEARHSGNSSAVFHQSTHLWNFSSEILKRNFLRILCPLLAIRWGVSPTTRF